MRAVAYVRVSTEKQVDFGVSLEAQEAKIRAMAVVQGADLVDVLVDAGESAKSLNRPGMSRLLEMVESRSIDLIIIAKLDRLTRSVADLAELLRRFERRGVSLVSVADALDTRSAAGRLVLNILVSVHSGSAKPLASKLETPCSTNDSPANASARCRSVNDRMRAALYARYSSDQQRAASIEDQLRLGREDAAAAGWTIVDEHTDPALSGASMMTRPGLQALLRGVEAGRYDVVWAEDLDRISRDLADPAIFFRKTNFAGVKIVTRSEGIIGPLHIGLKGTMNAIFLDALAQKTRRGLRGRIEAGKSAGGRSYGYRVVPSHIKGERGDLEVVPEQAEIIRRIFREFVNGISPKSIAKTLNAEGIPGPRAAWSPSTIHGHVGRGTGILNNELYVGRRIWARQRFQKNPDTGKRVAKPCPRSGVISKDVPELRIVADDLWGAAKARQATTRHSVEAGIVRARRPKYLFSGLTKCGECGGGFTLSSHDLLMCFNARERGTCTNKRRIKRQELEARVLRAMRERLFEPGAFAEFCASFTEELNRLRREHRAKLAAAPRELAAIDRRAQEILNLLLEGFRHEAFKDELRKLDERKAELTAAIAAMEFEPAMPALHPNMSEVFRQKASALAQGLGYNGQRDSARKALRGFIDQIVIPRGDGLLQVAGNLGAMLDAAAGQNMSDLQAVANVGCGGDLNPRPLGDEPVTSTLLQALQGNNR
jgi:site-specific DNA recombinase